MTGKNTILVMAPVGMALLAGAILPFQAASNATAGRVLGHPLWGALTSLAVSVMPRSGPCARPARPWPRRWPGRGGCG